MRRTLLVLSAITFLGGCGMVAEYRGLRAVVQEGVETAIEDRRSFNDTKAKVAMVLPCDMSLGAAMRIEDARRRAIIIELCGGPPADSQITVDELVRTIDAIRAQPSLVP